MKRLVLFLAAVTLLLCYSGVSNADDSNVVGTYISKGNALEYLILNADGTFYLKQRDRFAGPEAPYSGIEGKYEVKGKDVTLKLKDGGEAGGTIEGNIFKDGEGKVWAKAAEPTPMNREVRKGKYQK